MMMILVIISMIMMMKITIDQPNTVAFFYQNIAPLLLGIKKDQINWAADAFPNMITWCGLLITITRREGGAAPVGWNINQICSHSNVTVQSW